MDREFIKFGELMLAPQTIKEYGIKKQIDIHTITARLTADELEKEHEFADAALLRGMQQEAERAAEKKYQDDLDSYPTRMKDYEDDLKKYQREREEWENTARARKIKQAPGKVARHVGRGAVVTVSGAGGLIVGAIAGGVAGSCVEFGGGTAVGAIGGGVLGAGGLGSSVAKKTKKWVDTPNDIGPQPPKKPSAPCKVDVEPFTKTVEKKVPIDNSYLYVTLYDGTNYQFRVNDASFDIYKKREELDRILSKSKMAGDLGEEKVEYALKWLAAKGYQVVSRNCKSKYSDACILLCNKDYINEAQEYDHILVSGTSVIAIETKNLAGKITIESDESWTQEKDGECFGITNPCFQILRHHDLLASIVPQAHIIDVICIANEKTVIVDSENSRIPIVKVDQLNRYIEETCPITDELKEEEDSIIALIEQHKVDLK